MLVWLIVVLDPGAVLAQTRDTNPRTTKKVLAKSGSPVVLEQAKKIRWHRPTSRLIATGNVIVNYGKNDLKADTVYYNRTAETLEAFGSVRIQSPREGLHTARYVKIFLRTNELKMKKIRSTFDPWYVNAPYLDGDADTRLRMKDGRFTTCNLKTPHYFIQSDQVYIYPGDRIVAWHATLNVASVPIFYLPYAYIDLKNQVSRWEIRPGHSSESGVELEVNYHYLLPSDTGPYTSTIYTDFREKEGMGAGFDLGYDRPGRTFDFFTFFANRRPTEIDADGNEVRADQEKTLWRADADANYNFPETNWKFHADVDWIQNNRFDDDFQSSFGDRGAEERRANGSLVYSGDRSIFRVDTLLEEQSVQTNGDVAFETSREVLPRIQYQLFSLPLGFLGPGVFYSADAKLENSRNDPNEEKLASGSLTQQLTKSVPLTTRLGQSYRIGYEQLVREKPADQGDGNRSLGVGILGLTNSYRLNSNSTVDLTYSVEKRLNRENVVPFSLQGQPLGFEENGFRTHRFGLDYQWRYSRFSGTFQTGYDLRNADTASVQSDSRILSPQLNFNTRLTPRIDWSQYLCYDLAGSVLSQSNTTLSVNWNRRLSYSFGANYNRRSGDDFMKLTNGLRWQSSNKQWGLRGDLIYDQARTEYEEFRLMLRKRLHKWDFRIFFRTIRDRDTQVFFTFNLIDYPSQALGLSADIAEQGIDFERGRASQFQP